MVQLINKNFRPIKEVHLLVYEVLPHPGSLEFNFHISLNIISSFFPFSSALDFSVYEAITIDDLAEFSLLLIDSMLRVFALSSAGTSLQLESKSSPLSLFFFGGSS